MTEQDKMREAFKREFWRINVPGESYRDESLVFNSGAAKIAEGWHAIGWQAALSTQQDALERVKEVLSWVDGWEDGETFYEAAIKEIRAILSPTTKEA